MKLLGSEPGPWQPEQTRVLHPSSIGQLKRQGMKQRRCIQLPTLSRSPVFHSQVYPCRVNRDWEVSVVQQVWSGWVPVFHSACLASQTVQEVVRTAWNLFLGDTFLLWLASDFRRNSKFPGEITIRWGPLFQSLDSQKEGTVSLEYLHSCQDGYKNSLVSLRQYDPRFTCKRAL